MHPSADVQCRSRPSSAWWSRRASRKYVEGRHDAELVEKVWGDDLRIEGVVVEYLAGVDDLPERLREVPPGPECRAGVIVDHLVPGSKETKIAASVARGPMGGNVLVVGHLSSASGPRSSPPVSG